MTRILIIRHGETFYNLEDKFQGWVDSALTKKGCEQAGLLSERLINEKIDVIYSSPFKRAVRTAEIVRRHRKIPIIVEDRFKEIRCGQWEGLKFTEVREKFGEAYDTWDNAPHFHRIPEGETFMEVYERARQGIEHVIANHKGQIVLVSAHMVTTLLLMAFFGKDDIKNLWNTPKQGNTALNIVEIDESGRVDIILRGDSSHLSGTLTEYKFWEIGTA